jgi:hypothetical protein
LLLKRSYLFPNRRQPVATLGWTLIFALAAALTIVGTIPSSRGPD